MNKTLAERAARRAVEAATDAAEAIAEGRIAEATVALVQSARHIKRAMQRLEGGR